MKRFTAIPPARRSLLLEAAWSLIWARIMLKFLPFSRLAQHFSRLPRKPEVTSESRTEICGQVSSAVDRTADLLPGKVVCFPRGIAAQAMLRRRGISTTLYYGAKASDALIAHVWLQDGDRGVLGTPEDGEYTVLATYPPKPQTR